MKLDNTNTASEGIDDIKVRFESNDVEYGISGDMIWVYIEDYEVHLMNKGETVHTDSGSNSYFEFRETNGRPELIFETEPWFYYSMLGIDPEPSSFPLGIDARTAIERLLSNSIYSNDLEYLTSLGITELLEKCVTWDMFFFYDSYIDIEALTNTVEIDGEPNYSEYRISDSVSEFIPKIEDAIGTELELSDGYYKWGSLKTGTRAGFRI